MPDSRQRESLPEPGRNCWRVEKATRAAWLVDGAAYFRAFRSAVASARHSVLILAWDINSKLRLVRDENERGGAAEGLPVELADFLDAVVARRPDLRIHVLPWDFNVIYALEREWLSTLRLAGTSHEGLRCHLDDRHPVGGSQHQKVVVVDDRVAFTGGLDLTAARWDTPEHRPEDDRRIDPSGEPFPSFHDVQIVVEGPVAAALGEMARERWLRATGETIEPPPAPDGDSPWPDGTPPAIENVEVAIARTFPAYEDRPSVREVEALYLDVIREARRFLYFENQYFSSRKLGRALEERLREERGPEVILVMPLETSGWLEHHTMDILRAGLIERMRQADERGRLRVYYPLVVENGKTGEVGVHAKILVADDRMLLAGSANLSNRSMGLDSECNLAVEDRGDGRITEAIRDLRIRLLSEHLGLEPEAGRSRLGDPGSLVEAIEASRGNDRTLEPLPVTLDSELDRQIAESTWLDPERPVEPDGLIGRGITRKHRMTARKRIVIWTGVVAACLLFAGSWRWGILHETVNRDFLTSMMEGIRSWPLAPVTTVAIITILGAVGVPINLLLIAAILTYGPWTGLVCSLVGAELGALMTFGAGRVLGVRFIRKLAGEKLKKLSRTLAERGLLAMFLVRIVPVAPFVVVNLAAGASHVSWRSFAIGTLLGIIPGMLAVAVLGDRIEAVIYRPSIGTIVLLLLAAAAATGAVVVLRRWLGSR